MRGLCIDLGTSNTTVSSVGKAQVFTQPSFVTINTEDNIIIDAGQNSKDALGKTPENVIVVKPLAGGVIADYSAAEGMLKLLAKKAFNRVVFTGVSAVVTVPSNATQMEKRAVSEAVKNLGVSSVKVLPCSMAAAIGAGINVLTPTGSMVVDIGGGTTDAAVIALGIIATGVCIKDAGDSMDAAISAYVKRRYNVIIGDNTAERIKNELGCAIPRPKTLLGKYKGRDISTGLPTEFTVTSEEIRSVIKSILTKIVDSVTIALEKTPPELLSDVMEAGITITGGCANIYGLAEFFTKKTGFKTKVVENPSYSTLRGAEKALSDKKLKPLWKTK